EVRVLPPQPASAVSVAHVPTEKITATFPVLSRSELSLCNPNFRQSSHGRGTFGLSLCSRNLNLQITNPETQFELERDWFALLPFKCFGPYDDGAIERGLSHPSSVLHVPSG